MIKKIFVPLIEKEVILHIGQESWNKFVKDTKAKGRKSKASDDESIPPGEGSGRTWGSWVWVHDLKDTNTLIHEILHFLDDTYTFVACEDETEFKAYIGAHVLTKVLEWRDKVLEKEIT